MSWSRKVNLLDGVRLPSEGWVDVPGSPFQVMARPQDTLGVMYVRLHPDLTWSQWESFKQEIQARDLEIMRQHPLAPFFGIDQ
jgi:hypothetical protein